MKILIADDDLVSRSMLKGVLTQWGYDVALARDGADALDILQGRNAPELAILDWEMPGIEGSQVCETIRKQQEGK
jgi:CheY-like chemotaxis protein